MAPWPEPSEEVAGLVYREHCGILTTALGLAAPVTIVKIIYGRGGLDLIAQDQMGADSRGRDGEQDRGPVRPGPIPRS